MPEKIFLHLLILCAIGFLGIPGTFANEEIMESSDFLVRQKRVVSSLPDEDRPANIIKAFYVVRVMENMRAICVGSILSFYVVITAALCVPREAVHYQVAVNSPNIESIGPVHQVTNIRRRIENPRSTTVDGIALLIVRSPFMYNDYCKPIELYFGPITQGSYGKVYGWGYNSASENRGTNHPNSLRKIKVPIMPHRYCASVYGSRLHTSLRICCTFHEKKHSGHSDFGAGLALDGTLVGVFVGSGLIGNINPQYPDIFVLLQDTFYFQWIRTNLESIESHFENRRHH